LRGQYAVDERERWLGFGPQLVAFIHDFSAAVQQWPDHCRLPLIGAPACSASPSELFASPSELSASPSELFASPSELSASPSELFASPSELSASPSEPSSRHHS
jgi:hypothetical protein